MNAGADEAFRTLLAVQQRLVDYWWDVDCNGAREASSFYTQDCVYDMCGHRMDGPAAVSAYYDYRASRGERLVRHVLTNLRTTLGGAGEATVQGILTVYAADGVPVLPSAAPILVADNHATFRRDAAGRWHMQRHHIVALFRGGVPVLVPPTGGAAGR